MISIAELALIALVMLLVFGPTELLGICRQAGRLWAKIERVKHQALSKVGQLWD